MLYKSDNFMKISSLKKKLKRNLVTFEKKLKRNFTLLKKKKLEKKLYTFQEKRN